MRFSTAHPLPFFRLRALSSQMIVISRRGWGRWGGVECVVVVMGREGGVGWGWGLPPPYLLSPPHVSPQSIDVGLNLLLRIQAFFSSVVWEFPLKDHCERIDLKIIMTKIARSQIYSPTHPPMVLWRRGQQRGPRPRPQNFRPVTPPRVASSMWNSHNSFHANHLISLPHGPGHNKYRF